MNQSKDNQLISSKRIPASLIFIVVMLALAIMLVQGCTGARRDAGVDKGKSEKKPKSFTEALEIKPTKETAGFYNAIKDATRVVISESDRGLFEEDREATPLSYFTAEQPMFRSLMLAVTSATAGGEP